MKSGTESDRGPSRGRSGLTREQFAGLVEEHRSSLWLIAAGVCGSRADADDVVQEAALVGLDRLRTFEAGTSFAAWMSQIVRNIARNHARKIKRCQTFSMDGQAIDQQGRDSSHAAEARHRNPLDARGDVGSSGDFDARVLAALETLEETPRICLLLRAVGQLPYAHIARLLEIPEGTAMSHVHRSRGMLRNRLEAFAKEEGVR